MNKKMNKKELWAIIDVNEVINKTDIAKVIRCYDFKPWEINELYSIKKDNDEVTLNAFRWNYIMETLNITDETLNETGFMVRDLIHDIKMGYHRLSDDELRNFELSMTYDVYYGKCDVKSKIREMNFEYEIYRDFNSFKISTIHIYYEDNCNLTCREKNDEIDELLSYLELKE